MMNANERRNQLATMTIQTLKDTFGPVYGLSFKRCKRKADYIAEIVDLEEVEIETYEECNSFEDVYDFIIARKTKREENRQAKRDAKNVVSTQVSNEQVSNEEESSVRWNHLVCEMNMKDGKPFVYEHVADRPLLQQIMLNVCRDLYLDSQRAIKVSNGDKSVKAFGPVFVSKKHNGLRMKDAMAKGTVKAAAEKVLSKELQKKYIVVNPETKHAEFKQAVQVLDKLSSAGLIHGDDTDKNYAKFYSVYPEEILAFLEAVGCLKNTKKKSCATCAKCCPREGLPCARWEYDSFTQSDEQIASNCNEYVEIVKGESYERYGSPFETHRPEELIAGHISYC